MGGDYSLEVLFIFCFLLPVVDVNLICCLSVSVLCSLCSCRLGL